MQGKVLAEKGLIGGNLVVPLSCYKPPLRKDKFLCAMNFQYGSKKPYQMFVKNGGGELGPITWDKSSTICAKMTIWKSEGTRGLALITKATYYIDDQMKKVPKYVVVVQNNQAIDAKASINAGESITFSGTALFVQITLFCPQFDDDRKLNCFRIQNTDIIVLFAKREEKIV
jgi:hypothetical protein